MEIANCGLRIADCELRIANCELRIADCDCELAKRLCRNPCGMPLAYRGCALETGRLRRTSLHLAAALPTSSLFENESCCLQN